MPRRVQCMGAFGQAVELLESRLLLTAADYSIAILNPPAANSLTVGSTIDLNALQVQVTVLAGSNDGAFVEVSLSRNSVIGDTDDFSLSPFFASVPASPGTYTALFTQPTVTIPSFLPTGDYFLAATVDTLEDFDSPDANDVAFSPAPVFSARPPGSGAVDTTFGDGGTTAAPRR